MSSNANDNTTFPGGRGGAQWFLLAAFGAIVLGVSLGQAGLELGRGETPQALSLLRRMPTEARLRGFEEDLEDASWTIAAVRPWMQYAQYHVLGELGEYVAPGRDGWLFYRPALRYLTEPWPAEPEELERVLDAICALRDDLAARDIALLVVPVPGKPSVYPGKAARRAAGGGKTVRAHTRHLLERLETLGVETLNLGPVFDAARCATPEPLYLAHDTHWTPLGMRWAAEAVAARVIEEGWIAPGGTPYRLEPVDAMRAGDLVAMTQSPPVERAFPPQRVLCQQVVDAGTGALYRDAPGAEILLMGDSFLRIYQQDAPGSAGFAAHLAALLSQPVNSIVNDGGASALVRQELSRRPRLLDGKRVVIYEFAEREVRFGQGGWPVFRLP